jgi:hypothetical protein
VTVAYFLSDLGNSLIRVALFAFGIIHTLPYLVVTYTNDGGLRQFLADTLESFLYCIQPLAGQDSSAFWDLAKIQSTNCSRTPSILRAVELTWLLACSQHLDFSLHTEQSLGEFLKSFGLGIMVVLQK